MAITNGYATLAQLKTSLRIVDNLDDSSLELAIESSSRAIDTYAMRSFYSSGTATRYFAPDSIDIVNTDDMAGTAITIQTFRWHSKSIYKNSRNRYSTISSFLRRSNCKNFRSLGLDFCTNFNHAGLFNSSVKIL